MMMFIVFNRGCCLISYHRCLLLITVTDEIRRINTRCFVVAEIRLTSTIDAVTSQSRSCPCWYYNKTSSAPQVIGKVVMASSTSCSR